MIVVTSWDDGHPLDERLADLLARYGMSGTFFVPVRNSEGRPVLSGSALRSLACTFEIGGHTLDHVYLTNLDNAKLNHQINHGKAELEQLIGRRIKGFCYPGGRMNATVREAVTQAEFTYSRTTENLRIDCEGDPYRLPTTMQFYPHRKGVLIRNFLRHGMWAKKARLLKTAITSNEWHERLPLIAESIAETDGVLHIWGHSWEIEKKGLWRNLEDVLKRIASLKPKSKTILELISCDRDTK